MGIRDKTVLYVMLAGLLFLLKPLDTFWTEQKFEVHRFTNNLQGIQKVMVKDFPWNVRPIPWIALLFEKTSKQLSILDMEKSGFILNTCHDTAKRAETMVALISNTFLCLHALWNWALIMGLWFKSYLNVMFKGIFLTLDFLIKS